MLCGSSEDFAGLMDGSGPWPRTEYRGLMGVFQDRIFPVLGLKNRSRSSSPPNLKGFLVKTTQKWSEIPAFIGL